MRQAVVLLALVTALTPAFAGLIYDNGGPNGATGNDMTEWLQAEDFVLTAPATLTNVTFWSLEGSDAYQGNIFWQIYSDNAGEPGSLLPTLSGSATPTRTFDPDAGAFDLFGVRNDFSVGSVALLGGTTYWLVLHNGPLSATDPREFYWATTGSNSTLTGHEQDILNGPALWSDNGYEHAFNLSGTTEVPEPASLLLLGAGLLALGFVRRR